MCRELVGHHQGRSTQEPHQGVKCSIPCQHTLSLILDFNNTVMIEPQICYIQMPIESWLLYLKAGCLKKRATHHCLLQQAWEHTHLRHQSSSTSAHQIGHHVPMSYRNHPSKLSKSLLQHALECAVPSSKVHSHGCSRATAGRLPRCRNRQL